MFGTDAAEAVPFESPRKRLIYVDAAKCLAVVAVALGHSAYPTISGAVNWLDNMLLPLFWVAAGFTCTRNFSLGKRFRAIMLPYAWMSLACLLYFVVSHHGYIPSGTWLGFLYARFRIWIYPEAGPCIMGVDNSVLWFLPSLFTGYCILWCLIQVRKLYFQIFCAGASLIISTLLCRLPVLLPWSLDLAFFIAPLMWAGMRFRLLIDNNRTALILAISGWVVYAVVNQLSGPTNYSLREFGECGPIPIYFGAVGASMGVLVLFRWLGSNPLSRCLAWVNLEALYIFGLQLVFIHASLYICHWLSLGPTPTVLIQLLCALTGGLMAGKLVKRFSSPALFKKMTNG